MKKTTKRHAPRGERSRDHRPGSDVTADRRTILVLGAGRLAQRLRALVRRLGLECRAETRPLPALEQLEPRTGLVLVAPPLPDLSAADFCRRLRRRPGGSRLPVFVVGLPPKQARALYQAGASAQFDWPAERAALVRAVLRTVGTGGHPRSVQARDAALAAKVKERIDARRSTFGAMLGVEVQRGVVMLRGELDALWKISELERSVASIPGVQEVNTAYIRVPHRGIPDSRVSRSVGAMLRGAEGLDEKALAFDVSGGRVVLTGTVKSKTELTRAIGLIEQVDGVRAIENLAAIASRDRTPRDKLANALTALVRHQFPGARVSVGIFGKVAVLGGKARDAAERRAIEALAAEHPGVEGVISKVG